MSFSSFNLHPELLRAVDAMGFTAPTPIQRDAIPPGMAGRDVLACAVTGSGKTAAFLLPILHRLAGRRRGVTRVLVLTPTRELAAQIDDHRRQLARRVGIGGASVYGGVAMGPQEQAFRRGADVLVATPGRLLDHFRFPYARLADLDGTDRALALGQVGFYVEAASANTMIGFDDNAVAVSAVVPAQRTTLGAIKALYR